ncbi:hypothetical protein H0H92_015398 [Tricholoma furcatifolium]|nr:hypothetical protein H0H92_015398 [Tricholoma furcatifolium]
MSAHPSHAQGNAQRSIKGRLGNSESIVSNSQFPKVGNASPPQNIRPYTLGSPNFIAQGSSSTDKGGDKKKRS